MDKGQDLKLGVGICTRNRAHGLSKTLMKLLQYRNEGPLWYDIFVADDGSEDEAQKHVLERILRRILSESEPRHLTVDTNFGTSDNARVGVAKNKNRILRRFADCDYVVIFEDDVWPIHADWLKVHIDASRASGIHHFNFVPHSMPKHVGHMFEVSPYTLPDGELINVALTQYTTGVFLFYTQRVIQMLGGFDRRFGLYGFEHVEFSDRIRDPRIGLSPPGKGYPSILECEKYIYWNIHEPSVVSDEEKRAELEKQKAVWAEVQRDMFLYRQF